MSPPDARAAPHRPPRAGWIKHPNQGEPLRAPPVSRLEPPEQKTGLQAERGLRAARRKRLEGRGRGAEVSARLVVPPTWPRGRHSEEKTVTVSQQTRDEYTNSGDKISAQRGHSKTEQNPGPGGPFESGRGEDRSPRGTVVTAMLRAIPPAAATPGGRVPRPGWRAKPDGKESAAAGRSKGTHSGGRCGRRERPPEGSGPCRQEGWGRERRPGEGGRGGAQQRGDGLRCPRRRETLQQ